MLEITKLEKSFRKKDGGTVHAVRGVDLTIPAGEVFSLLGPNGAGKTTLISMISGLLKPTGGDAVIGGHSITAEPIAAKTLIGVVPQEIALYPSLSARRNLRFFGRMYGLVGQDLDRRTDAILEFIDLRDRQNDKIETFSGGMKRRVNIGVGLIHSPRLVIMDEPTVGVDPQSRRRILDTVLRLRDENQTTVLYTTHLMEEAQELSDRVGIIDNGTIIALGTQRELIAQIGTESSIILSVADRDLPAEIEAKLAAIDGVIAVTVSAPERGNADASSAHEIALLVAEARNLLPSVIARAAELGITVGAVEVNEPNLETVFLHLTGRALRD